MWRYPSLPPPEPRAAPEDRGERLATIPRNRGGEELRVSLDTYEGRPYVSVRVWALGRDGQWWPTKKGCSVRVRELEQVARALMVAKSLVEGPPPSRPAPGPTRRGALPAPARGELPGPASPGREFDEF